MSPDITDIIDSAEGTIDAELLQKQGGRGFISTGYLHDKPLVEYLMADESLEYLFDNTKKGVTVFGDSNERTVTPNRNYRTILAVTSQRVLCVVGKTDGDEIIEVPLTEVTDTTVKTGLRKDLMKIHSSSAIVEFYTRSNPEVPAAADYIDQQKRAIKLTETAYDGTKPVRESHESTSKTESTENTLRDTEKSEERGHGVRSDSEKKTGAQLVSDNDSTSPGEVSSSPGYLDKNSISNSTLQLVHEAETKARRASEDTENTDRARLLTRAHNIFCRVLDNGGSGIDRESLERRIVEIEKELDSLQTTHHRPEETDTDEATDVAEDDRERIIENTEDEIDAEQSMDKKEEHGTANIGASAGNSSQKQDSEELSRRVKMIHTIEELAAELDRIPKYGDMHDHGPFEAKEYSKEFTSWQDALEATDIDIQGRLIDNLQSVGEQLGRAPTKSEFERHGIHSSSRHVEHFGSYDEALSAAGLEKPSRDTLLDELRRLENEVGCAPTSNHVKEYGNYPVTYYRKQFGSVRKAVEKAGMDYKSDILDAVRALAVSLGHRPKLKEFNEYALYSSSYTYNYFDGWRELCEAAGVESDDSVEKLIASLSQAEADSLIQNAAVTEALYKKYKNEHDHDDEATIIDTIRTIAIGTGRRPKSAEYAQFSKHSSDHIYKYFDTWSDACKAADVNSDKSVKELIASLTQSDIDELLQNATVNETFHEVHSDIDHLKEDTDGETPEELHDNQTRKTLLEKLEATIDDLGRLPTYSEMYDHDGIRPKEYSQEFGSWDDALRATDVDVEERLLTVLRDVGPELGRAPTKSEVDERGTYDSQWYSEFFDSWKEAVTEAGLQYPTRSELLDELRRLEEELGYVPVRHHVEEHGAYPPQFYRREFDSVKQATATAGLDYRDDIVNIIQQLAIELGRKPKMSEFEEEAPYSNSYVYNHFDTWGEACQVAGVDSDEKIKELIADSAEGKESAQPESTDDIVPSPLAEYYEAFGNLVAAQKALFGDNPDQSLGESEPTSRWHTLVRDRWAGDDPERFSESYGSQQNERENFTMSEYREKYGNGKRVTEFQAIETTSLSEATVQLWSDLSEIDKSSIRLIQIPKAPESDEPLPVLVESMAEYERAEALIDEFPKQPRATTQQQDTGTDDEGSSAPTDDEDETGEEGKDGGGNNGADGDLTDIGGVTQSIADALRNADYHTKDDLKAADREELAAIEGVGSQTANRIKLLVGG